MHQVLLTHWQMETTCFLVLLLLLLLGTDGETHHMRAALTHAAVASEKVGRGLCSMRVFHFKCGELKEIRSKYPPPPQKKKKILQRDTNITIKQKSRQRNEDEQFQPVFQCENNIDANLTIQDPPGLRSPIYHGCPQWHRGRLMCSYVCCSAEVPGR